MGTIFQHNEVVTNFFLTTAYRSSVAVKMKLRASNHRKHTFGTGTLLLVVLAIGTSLGLIISWVDNFPLKDGPQNSLGDQDNGLRIDNSATDELMHTLQNDVQKVLKEVQGITQITKTSANTLNNDKFVQLYLGDHTVMCGIALPTGVGSRYHMMLDSRDTGIVPHFCRGLGWESETTRAFMNLVGPDDHILDVGANYGWYTATLFFWMERRGRILAVEAQPRTFQLLQSTLEFNGLLASGIVQVVNFAGSDEDDKTVSMSYIPARPLNNHIILSDEEHPQSEGIVNVTTVKIDTLVYDWTRLDFIKIDVEGAEYSVWKGMVKTRERFPHMKVVIEMNYGRMQRHKLDFDAFVESLETFCPQTMWRKIGQNGDLEATSRDEIISVGNQDVMLVLHC